MSVAALLLLIAAAGCRGDAEEERRTMHSVPDLVELPSPELTGPVSVEEALASRASVREFAERELTLAEAAQLLWSAQGITRPGGYRTAPSAGALYPLEVYLAARAVAGLEPGVYRYLPHDHALEPTKSGDVLDELSAASLGQESIAHSRATIVIAAVFDRTTVKYGDRGVSYVHAEVGAAAQNVYLQAEALGLGTVYIGAFEDDRVRAVVGTRANEHPLCLLPVGEPLPGN